jgi:hypothetical protein
LYRQDAAGGGGVGDATTSGSGTYQLRDDFVTARSMPYPKKTVLLDDIA